MEKSLNVKFISGYDTDIQIDFTKNTGLDLKKKIIDEKGLVPASPDIYKLVYGGKLIDEEMVLDKNRPILLNKSTVHMVNIPFLRKISSQTLTYYMKSENNIKTDWENIDRSW